MNTDEIINRSPRTYHALKRLLNKVKYPLVIEMITLRTLLDEGGIKWEDKSDENVARTHITIGNREISVINGIGTDGGEDLFTGDNEGLLEAWSNSGEDPIGRLTASEVMKMVCTVEIIEAFRGIPDSIRHMIRGIEGNIVYNTIYREKLKAVDKKR